MLRICGKLSTRNLIISRPILGPKKKKGKGGGGGGGKGGAVVVKLPDPESVNILKS
jgi:hypothetical protein